MNKIRIHRFNNTMWGRAHLPFFKSFDKYLSNYFEVEVINYNKDGTTYSGPITTKCSISSFGNNPLLTDVDYLIENNLTGELKLFSFTEYFNSYISHIAKSKYCSKVLLAHFNWTNVYYWMKRENAIEELYKIEPYIFLPFLNFDVKKYRKIRYSLVDFEEKMFWLGSGVDSYRKAIRIVETKGYLQKITPVDHQVYLDKLVASKLALSYYLDLDKYNTPYDHPGEFCYRDIEYLSCGVPFIRIEFKDQVKDPLLPNHHYISIPREHAYVAYEKGGDEAVANLYIEKYNEVIGDNKFLEFISKNQIKWYDKNLGNNNKEKLTFKWLNLQEWR